MDHVSPPFVPAIVPVTDIRDNALGAGLSHCLTLHGLVQHTLYHSDQIALLKRYLEAAP